MLRKCIKRTASIASRARKSARVNNIIDKSVIMLTWTPIITVIYLQVLVLAYSYSKTNIIYDNTID